MSLDIFSSLFGSFSGRRKRKKTYGANRRALHLECLETRTVLSATVAAGVAVNNSPSISEVAVSIAKREITWNAAAGDGVRSSSIAIDGATQPTLYGPYKAAPGENFAWAFNSPASGNHTYVITVVNNAGATTTTSGTFTIALGPNAQSRGGVAFGLTVASSHYLGCLVGQRRSHDRDVVRWHGSNSNLRPVCDGLRLCLRGSRAFAGRR